MNKRSHDIDIMRKCDVCGRVVLVNQYGQGVCDNCTWENSGSDLDNVYACGSPNLVSLGRARELYKQGRPLMPNFEDFIIDYKFYKEMEFYLNGIKYMCFYDDNKKKYGLFTEDKVLSYFDSIDNFAQNSKIGNSYLKDIWNNVKNVDWLN